MVLAFLDFLGSTVEFLIIVEVFNPHGRSLPSGFIEATVYVMKCWSSKDVMQSDTMEICVGLPSWEKWSRLDGLKAHLRRRIEF